MNAPRDLTVRLTGSPFLFSLVSLIHTWARGNSGRQEMLEGWLYEKMSRRISTNVIKITGNTLSVVVKDLKCYKCLVLLERLLIFPLCTMFPLTSFSSSLSDWHEMSQTDARVTLMQWPRYEGRPSFSKVQWQYGGETDAKLQSNGGKK